VKLLALYDIHGNVDALEAVLADPRAADPDLVVVGGDAVPGPFARATLARLQELSASVRWIRGNGEREVAQAVGAPAPADDDMAARTAALSAAEIGDDQARTLGELPLTVELDGVLFCHASPRRDDEMLTRLSSSQRWADALAGVDAALVVAGHTHQQDDRSVGGVRFVNAAVSGCLTRATAPRAGCGSPTASPSCAPPPTTPRVPARGCSRPAGPTDGRSRRRSSSPSSRSS
jgi:predicted phosphodiesterase